MCYSGNRVSLRRAIIYTHGHLVIHSFICHFPITNFKLAQYRHESKCRSFSFALRKERKKRSSFSSYHTCRCLWGWVSRSHSHYGFSNLSHFANWKRCGRGREMRKLRDWCSSSVTVMLSSAPALARATAPAPSLSPARSFALKQYKSRSRAHRNWGLSSAAATTITVEGSMTAMTFTMAVTPASLTPRGLCSSLRRARHHHHHHLLLSHGRRMPCRPAMASFNPLPQQAQPPQLHPGTYGPWSVDAADVREVVLYRTGLVTAATTFIAAASTALLPDDNAARVLIQSLYDPLYVVGAGGLGASLALIHIYVTPIKRTLQALWAVGVLGSLGVAVNFAAPANQGLVEFVLHNPAAIWAVGPLFASLTGLVFKEGLCYGKPEAAALFFVIPSLLLGRLSGAMDEKVQLGLLAAWMALFALFASRKFTQPIKDDIGDKSVFMFNALPEDEQQALLLRLQGGQQALQTDRSE